MSKLATRKKLGELCSVVTKGTTPTSLGMKFEDEGVPFLRIQNLSGSSVHLKDILYISEDTHNALNRSKIMPGDFLITIAGTIGRVAIVPDDFPEANCNQAVAILRFDKSKLLPRYLLHWLTTNDALRQISGKKVTATISNLSLGQIKELEIPLPPLDEQKRIAAILDKADAIRRKRQQAIQLADDFLRSVFLDMFGDPMFGNVFERKTFLEIATLQQGLQIPISKRKKEAGADRYKYLTVKYLNGKGEDEYIELPRKSVIVNKNQVLMTRTGNTGQVISGVEGVFHNNFFRIDYDELLLDKSYLVNFLTFPKIKSLLLRLASTTTIPDLNHSDFLGVSLQIPPMESQKEFSRVEVKVKKSRLRLIQSLTASNSLFNSLSQKAFAGEL